VGTSAFVWSRSRGLLMAAGLLACAGATHAQKDQAPAVKDFEARVSGYEQLEKGQSSPHKPTDSPAKLADQHEQAAAKMRAARAGAKQGDIFTAGIASYFRHQIASTLNGPDGAKIKASLRHAEPVKKISLRVNERYPQKIPLQSTPPTLLLNLPQLPKQLQYRIVGNDLVLYDSNSDLVVDFMENALPGS
jgi:hypothetical protein